MATVEEIVGKVLNIDPASVNNTASPHNVESWDSFNALMIVAEIEKKFGVNISIDEVASIKNVGDIKKILRAHQMNV